jgi:cytochrome P450
MSTPDQTTPACVAAYNPVDPKELEDPFPSYNELRRAAPVFYNAQFDSWMVMRPEDILTMQRDTASFSSKSIMSPQHPLPPEVVAVLGSDEIKLPTLLTTDPPDHARLRSLLNKGFSAQSIAAREPAVRAVADELIDSFVGDGHAELMSQFAFPFTAIVIGDMLGVPRADNAQLKRWSDDWMTLIFALAPVEQLVEAAHGLMAFQRYFAEVMAERRAHPGAARRWRPAQPGGADRGADAADRRRPRDNLLLDRQCAGAAAPTSRRSSGPAR